MILLKIFLISYFLFLISYFFKLYSCKSICTPARIVSVSELKESTFVIPRANFFLMFYCPFRKKRYICRRGTLNNLNCRKPQKRSRKPIAGLRQIMYLCTCNVTKNTTTN